MPPPPGDLDAASFWEDSDYAREKYVDDPLTPEKVATVEERLGYKLPAAYVALCRVQNGGLPRRKCHRTRTPTSDYVVLTGIYSIGEARTFSLCGELGSEFMMEEWGYPPIGVYFGSCPSAGHDMLCLDYRDCGPQGEPAVVHVDQECDYEITFVAPSFEAFIRGLEEEKAFTVKG